MSISSIRITLSGVEVAIGSIEELDVALDEFNQKQLFELWVSTSKGPSMAMFRNGEHAWLMYLRFSG